MLSKSVRTSCRRRGGVELVLGGVAPPETGEPPYERAALNYLARYMAEGSPSLADLAQMAAVPGPSAALLMRGLQRA